MAPLPLPQSHLFAWSPRITGEVTLPLVPWKGFCFGVFPSAPLVKKSWRALLGLGELDVHGGFAFSAPNSSQVGSVLPPLLCKPGRKGLLSLPKELQTADGFLAGI